MRPSALVLLLFAAAAACAGASAPTAARPDSLLVEVMDLAGVRRMVEQIPAQVKAAVARDSGRLPEALRARLAVAMEECYNTAALMRTLTGTIGREAKRDQLAAALELLRSPLSLRFTELEVRAGTPEARELMQSYVNRMSYSPPATERLALIERIDEESGTTGLVVEIAVSTASSVARSIAGASSPLTAPERARLDEAVDRMREQLLPGMRQQVHLLLLFTYREVNDGELTRYLNLCASPTGQWLSRACGSGLRAALGRAATELGRKLATPPK